MPLNVVPTSNARTISRCEPLWTWRFVSGKLLTKFQYARRFIEEREPEAPPQMDLRSATRVKRHKLWRSFEDCMDFVFTRLNLASVNSRDCAQQGKLLGTTRSQKNIPHIENALIRHKTEVPSVQLLLISSSSSWSRISDSVRCVY